jgi:drug resistance transporter, EmrB/QacA subfamily
MDTTQKHERTENEMQVEAATDASSARPQQYAGGQNIRGFALFSVIAALMLTLLLEALDQTIVGTALPQIIAQFQGFDRYSWVGTAYLLASITTIPITGKLSDQFGRKWFFICGVIIFLLGSFLSGAAQSMNQLIAFRAIQGFGSGMGISLVFAAVGEIIPPAERARWQGIFSGVFGFSSVVGPTLGGWLTDHGPLLGTFVTATTRWRWIFYVNLPLGCLALLALFIYYPNHRLNHSGENEHRGWAAVKRIDFLGAGLIAAATICLLLGLSWGSDQTYAWNSLPVVSILVAAGILYAVFGVNERFAVEPILPLKLFKSRVFSADSVLALMIGMIMLSLVYYLPFFLQGVLGTSATDSGLVITPLTISTVVGAATSGILIGRFGRYKIIAIAGGIIICIGTFLLTRLTITTSFAMMSVYMIVAGLGLGIFFPLLTLVGQNAHPRRLIGVTTSTINYLRSLGQTLGLAIVGTVVTHAVNVQLPSLLPAGAKQLPPLALQYATNSEVLISPSYREQIQQTAIKAAQKAAISQATAHVPAGPAHAQTVATISQQVGDKVAQQVQTLLHQIFHAVLQAFAIGIVHGFETVLIFCGIVLVTTFFLKDIPLAARAQKQEIKTEEMAQPVAVE